MVFSYKAVSKKGEIINNHFGIVFGEDYSAAADEVIEYYGLNNIIELNLKLYENAGDWLLEADTSINNKPIFKIY